MDSKVAKRKSSACEAKKQRVRSEKATRAKRKSSACEAKKQRVRSEKAARAKRKATRAQQNSAHGQTLFSPITGSSDIFYNKLARVGGKIAMCQKMTENRGSAVAQRISSASIAKERRVKAARALFMLFLICLVLFKTRCQFPNTRQGRGKQLHSRDY